MLGLSEAAFLKLRIAVGALLLVALAGLVIWYGEWRAHSAQAMERAKYDVAIGKLKADAAVVLAVETSKVRALEGELRTAHDQIEVMGHDREALSNDYERRLAAAASAGAGRLRDPNAERGCGGGAPAAPGAATANAGAVDAPEAGGLLSADLTRLLLRLQREADAINDAYAVCRPDAVTLRQQLSPP